MSLVLPALRLSRVQQRLADEVGLGPNVIREIMQIVEDEVEVGARRIGNLCPSEGCRRILDDHTRHSGPNTSRWQECADHGTVVSRALPLVIAFDPVTS